MRLYRRFQVIDAIALVVFVVLAAVLTPGAVGLMLLTALGAYMLGHQTGVEKPTPREARASTATDERHG